MIHDTPDSHEVINRIRQKIIAADNDVISKFMDLEEPLDRFDLASRERYLLELTRFAGIREGIGIARLAIEQAVQENTLE